MKYYINNILLLNYQLREKNEDQSHKCMKLIVRDKGSSLLGEAAALIKKQFHVIIQLFPLQLN
jgi:hypothetical protein